MKAGPAHVAGGNAMETASDNAPGRFLTLYHFPKKEGAVVRVRERTQTKGMKPEGLWLSDESRGDGWSAWCREEGFRECRVRQAVLIDTAGLLCLRTRREVIRFTREYAKELPAARKPPGTEGRMAAQSGGNVDWPRVAERWGGVLFVPYHRDLTADDGVVWYTAVDVPGACVWRPEQVAALGAPEQC